MEQHESSFYSTIRIFIEYKGFFQDTELGRKKKTIYYYSHISINMTRVDVSLFIFCLILVQELCTCNERIMSPIFTSFTCTSEQHSNQQSYFAHFCEQQQIVSLCMVTCNNRRKWNNLERHLFRCFHKLSRRACENKLKTT